jgi:Fic family protein
LQLEDAMIEAVFGSNAIESAGLDERLTAKICRDIFRGIDVKAEDIDERDPDYAELLQKGHQGVHEIIRSRAEVIQHAKALKYIVKAIVDNSEPLTEIIIKETHKILCHGENLDYPAGVYRNFQIGAKYGLKKKVEFMRPSAVPENMEKLCEDYNSDVSNTEITGVIDPMSLAARYCSTFVNIHPFADGNGRMCRLILNSILLKYAGICVPIGEGDEREREKYISLTTRASKKFYREHMEVEREDETAHLELGILVTKKSRSKLRALYEALTHPRKH